MNQPITFVATGDSFITRRLPGKDEAFKQLSSLIKQADVRFTNLEVTTHYFEGIPGAVSGGTWAVAPPDVLEDLKAYGFNVMSWATNHTLDYSYGGLEATERYLNQHGIIHAGAGRNLAEAGAPRYLETPAGRVALISVTSTFHETWVAGEQRPDMVGRPGINPLRYESIHTISPEKMKQLKVIAETVEMNAVKNLAIKEGLEKEEREGEFSFGQYKFIAGVAEGKTTVPNQKDVNRIMKTVLEAKRQADFVLMSVHSHEMKGEDKTQPADFLRTFAKTCIDEGVDAVIGHGPHILRGIEIYKNRPIFYSLGNFIFQNETMTGAPTDFYDKFGLDHHHTIADAFDARTDKSTKGFPALPDIWESVVPVWKMGEGRLLEIELFPIELGFGQPRSRRGWPVVSYNHDILEKLKVLSSPFGTTIEIEGGIGKVIMEDNERR